MTRGEHIEWCKQRAIQEYDYYAAKGSLSEAIRNGMASMMSDLNKHEETRSPALQALCLGMIQRIRTHAEFVSFIKGFN